MFDKGLDGQKSHQLLPSVHLHPVVQVLGLGSWGLVGDSLWEVYHSRKQNNGLHLPSLTFYESYKFCYTACSHFLEVLAL